jgi:hypothetical protein
LQREIHVSKKIIFMFTFTVTIFKSLSMPAVPTRISPHVVMSQGSNFHHHAWMLRLNFVDYGWKTYFVV